ncbi:putative ribosomal protein S19/S15 [Helianthus annuus]|nr:putative ribosomal protein S19/S15 [Helianthus annuus]KAJ0564623.1 putative ribosomal protein S19/S15 [Helianthus annuus]KAJ0729966.1 putative ribosomal protein S19/S15 [Helianthus annuus]KAJ0732664.1 putative ribosomal protein S19/S15 [Helianthus annuus]
MLVSIQRVQRTSDQRDINGICDDGHHDRTLRLHFGNGDVEESSDTSSGLNTPCEREPKNAKLTHESSITKHKSSQWDCLNGSDPKADVEVDVAAAGAPKKRTFKKFSFRGVDLDALLDMSTDELVKLFTARARRRFQRGLKRKPMALIKKLHKVVTLRKQRSLFIHLVG